MSCPERGKGRSPAAWPATTSVVKTWAPPSRAERARTTVLAAVLASVVAACVWAELERLP